MIHLMKQILCSKDEYLILFFNHVYYIRIRQDMCLSLNQNQHHFIKTHICFEGKVLGWDSAGGSVIHNLTLLQDRHTF